RRALPGPPGALGGAGPAVRGAPAPGFQRPGDGARPRRGARGGGPLLVARADLGAGGGGRGAGRWDGPGRGAGAAAVGADLRGSPLPGALGAGAARRQLLVGLRRGHVQLPRRRGPPVKRWWLVLALLLSLGVNAGILATLAVARLQPAAAQRAAQVP